MIAGDETRNSKKDLKAEEETVVVSDNKDIESANNDNKNTDSTNTDQPVESEVHTVGSSSENISDESIKDSSSNLAKLKQNQDPLDNSEKDATKDKDTDSSSTSDLGSSIAASSENSQSNIPEQNTKTETTDSSLHEETSKSQDDAKPSCSGDADIVVAMDANNGVAMDANNGVAMDANSGCQATSADTDCGDHGNGGLSEADLEKMRSYWKPKHVNLASQLEGKFQCKLDDYIFGSTQEKFEKLPVNF